MVAMTMEKIIMGFQCDLLPYFTIVATDQVNLLIDSHQLFGKEGEKKVYLGHEPMSKINLTIFPSIKMCR